MKAISIRQPFAEAILRGVKTTEYRTWPTKYRGLILVHAGLSRADLSYCKDYGVKPDQLVFGAIAGTVEIADCQAVDDPETGAIESWDWLLANPRPFARPVFYKGGLKFFKVPDNLVADQLASRPAD